MFPQANSLQEDIGKIKKEIEELAQISKITAAEREAILTGLDKELGSETELLENTIAKLTAADKAMESFGKILDRTFFEAGCSDDMIIGMLGKSQNWQMFQEMWFY